ncbi:hypothetical protein M0L39_RS18270 [Providencia rettgeri]|uniref:hypothetical protein n=1 Tax=Providencia rettgeri TaxID=587 RepID=UPI0008080F04|nr:hypothetical protein [Providencia rettgeri]EJD6601879.1 hypothetical protein [Providencia rettgeri]ELR5255765.1 hypothetical protein [Providencia rettgeri]MBS6209394.1 hypothetical protein [Proteus hauseri]OBY35354.1 hypothetical protein PR729_21940 [Providencia rettgeri]
MIPIQEVDIYSDNNIKISAHIVVPNQSIAAAEIVIYDQNYNPFYSTYCPLGQYSSAKEAYEAIIDASQKYMSKSGGTINRINNRCNTEFVTKKEQQTIIDSKSIANVQVEVNT